MSRVFADILQLGQSLWYDNISRDLLDDGTLAAMVAAGEIRGLTSNPSIFEKAIKTGDLYRSAVDKLLKDRPQLDAVGLYEALVIDDIRAAADVLRPVYEQSRGRDGFVSLEVSPRLALDTQGTVAEARRLHAAVDRPNLMIKVPATDAGLPAVTQLIDDGISVNVTLLFSHQDWRRSAQAYLQGVRQRLARGLPVDSVASVASFFVSRLDTAVDAQLDQGSALRGRIAVAYAQVAYAEYRALFDGPDFADLAGQGAQIQRLLWASTGTKNPSYSDLLYVENLVAPDTVNTLPPQTLDALRDHGQARGSLQAQIETARSLLQDLPSAGVDIEVVTADLKRAGVEAFVRSFDGLLEALRHNLD